MTGSSSLEDDYQRAATFLRDFHCDRHRSSKLSFELDVIHEALDDAVSPPPKSTGKLQKKQASMCLVSMLGADVVEAPQDPPELCCDVAPQGAKDESSWGHFIDDDRASAGRCRKRMIPRHSRKTATAAVWKPKRGRSNT